MAGATEVTGATTEKGDFGGGDKGHGMYIAGGRIEAGTQQCIGSDRSGDPTMHS